MADDLETVALLSEAAPSAEPPAGFRARLIGRVNRELDSTLPPKRALVGAHAFRMPWRRATALVTLMLLALASAFLTGRQYAASQALLIVPLRAQSSGGSVTIVVRASGATELELHDVPDPAPGRVYQAWVVDEQGNRRSVGVYDSGHETYHLEQPVLGRKVELTEEPAPHSQSPTTSPLFAGQVAP